METEETNVTLEPSNTEIIKEAAIKAAATAVVAVVVTQLATFAMNKAAEALRNRKDRRTNTNDS
jgi:hypothetical protein